MKENTQEFFDNLRTFHHRIMARFLKNRGWVVMYLPKDQRYCNHKNGICWIDLYNSEERKP